MDDGLNPNWATRVEKLSLADGFPGAYRHSCEQLVQNLKTFEAHKLKIFMT